MEQEILERMGFIRWALAKKYEAKFRGDKKQYDRADTFIIDVTLNRVRNRPALLGAIAKITREADTGFTMEQMDWILERSKKQPDEVKSLLIIACRTNKAKKK